MKTHAMCLLLLFFTATVWAQADKDNIEDDREVYKVSDGYKIIAPKGTEFKKKDGQLIVEDVSSVLTRQIEEIKQRLDAIEAKAKTPEGENLKQIVDQLERRINSLEQHLKTVVEKQDRLRDALNSMQYQIDAPPAEIQLEEDN